MVVFGITGGTGSGKTSVLNIFSKMGAAVIDCDALYNDMMKPGSTLHGEIAEAFGDVFAPDGTLDRKKLGERVFNDKSELRRLDAITFEHFKREVRRLVAEQRAAGRRITAVDGITLIQGRKLGMFECDCMIGVVAPEDIREERIMARDGITRDMARARILAQAPDKFYYDNCDVIIVNDCESREEFEAKTAPEIEALVEKTEEGQK
jgi:dephospho-CoA kinase